jgi:hypothetical protein
MGEKKRRFDKKGKELYFRTTRTKETLCLACGANLTAATSVWHNEVPYPGAVALCFMCNHIQIYDENLNFRELNDEEIVDIAGNEEIITLINANSAAKVELAVKDEVFAALDEKMKNLHPTVICVLNHPITEMMYCATDPNMPGHTGYGPDPKEALRALLRSYAAELLKNATEKYHKRERPS